MIRPDRGLMLPCRRAHRGLGGGQRLDRFGQRKHFRRMTFNAICRVGFSHTRYVSFEHVARNRVHRHSFFEPCIVLSGSGDFEYGATVYRLREGDLFIADPGTYHEVSSLNTRDLKLYFLAFTIVRTPKATDTVERALFNQKTLARFLVSHAFHLPGQTHLIPLFEHVSKLSRNVDNKTAAAFHHEASLLLLSQIVTALTAAAGFSDDERDESLLNNRVVESIEHRLHEPLRIAALARACGMSERTLRRRWRNRGGRSLTDEINDRRIERASHLLLLPDISVAEAGYQVGIANPAQFSRLFRRIKGLTPKAYRRRILTRLPSAVSGQPPFRTEFLDGGRREYER